jgi:hypothetical protein
LVSESGARSVATGHEYQKTHSPPQEKIEHDSRSKAGSAQVVRELERRYQEITTEEKTRDGLAEVNLRMWALHWSFQRNKRYDLPSSCLLFSA